MDNSQKNHLKAYGIAYWILKHDVEIYWLLNYRGGSFMTKYEQKIEDECKIRGVSYEVIPDGKVNQIITEVSAVRSLTPEQAARRLPVRLHGVVTYVFDPRSCFIQDQTAGIYVGNGTEAPSLSVGFTVRIKRESKSKRGTTARASATSSRRLKTLR